MQRRREKHLIFARASFSLQTFTGFVAPWDQETRQAWTVYLRVGNSTTIYACIFPLSFSFACPSWCQLLAPSLNPDPTWCLHQRDGGKRQVAAASHNECFLLRGQSPSPLPPSLPATGSKITSHGWTHDTKREVYKGVICRVRYRWTYA